MVSPLLKLRMWSWQVVVIFFGPWGMPLMTMPQEPQIPSRQSLQSAVMATGAPRSSPQLIVERERELETLARALDDGRHGTPSVVLLLASREWASLQRLPTGLSTFARNASTIALYGPAAS
jgi:hypothetical protein